MGCVRGLGLRRLLSLPLWANSSPDSELGFVAQGLGLRAVRYHFPKPLV